MIERIEFTGPPCPGCKRPRKVTIYHWIRHHASPGHGKGAARTDRQTAKTCGRRRCQVLARALTTLQRDKGATL